MIQLYGALFSNKYLPSMIGYDDIIVFIIMWDIGWCLFPFEPIYLDLLDWF